ncbi:MAG: type II secretion system F family protein [Hyphomonadaceae bacterium]
MDQQTLLYAAIAGAFVLVLAVLFVFSGGSAGKGVKRAKALNDGSSARAKTAEAMAKRKQMTDTLKGLQAREAAARSRREVGKSIEARLKQAGLSMTVSTFWMMSAGLGVAAGVAAWFVSAGAMEIVTPMDQLKRLAICAGAGFAGGLGIPRWILGMAIKGRQKKFMLQFADAIDVIVRGVKSGLPLNECLKVIARESPQPLAAEFDQVCDALSMGVSLDGALAKMYQRTPIQEVNFFNIVLAIQQKAGGNLSEALGNLSTVLRSRKLLREKIKALSSEAKASAMIIGALPVIVMLLVYLTTPDYITQLFITQTGHFILLIAAALMGIGIYIMRSMINFDF